ncbi:Flavin-dependent thymidylate synthase [Alphaproteobacteria bacterium]
MSKKLLSAGAFPPLNMLDEKSQDVADLRAQQSGTLRVTVPALEEILYRPVKVLDHGFIRVIDYMGDDQAIVQAARASYGKGTKKVNEDKGLINYLMRHSHTTPFEMCEVKLHVKLPIFVARHWVRHRTANINEYSARYSVLSKEFYIPESRHLSAQSTTNKQGREASSALPAHESQRVLELLRKDAELCYAHYLEMLNLDEENGTVLDPKRSGLARELARMNLTLNYYTQLYWKIDLHNLLHFLKLRTDSKAQLEIREYAQAILAIVARWVPNTYEAFVNHRLNAVNLSERAVEVVKKMLAGSLVAQGNSGLSKREWDELMEVLL